MSTHRTQLFRALGLTLVALSLALGGCDKKSKPPKEEHTAPTAAPKKETKKDEAQPGAGA